MTHRAGRFALPLPFAALILACLPLGCARTPPAAEEEPPPAPVKVDKARTMPLGEWTELLGTTQPLPQHAARITAAVEGRVMSILGDGRGKAVTEGERVEAGQVIVQLDDRVARANRAKVEAGQKEMEEQKKQAEYAVELALIELQRLEELRKTSSAGGATQLVSRVEVDKARLALKDAESRQKAVAAREQAHQAELKALDEQLDLYTLRAPITGRLGLVQVVPGQTLAVGTAVADVLDLDEIDVLCFVPPRTAARLTLGQAIRPAGESAAPAGKLVFLALQAQPDTGNFAAKARFPNRDLRLRANMVQRVEVLTQAEKPRLTLPWTALLEDRDPPEVVVVLDVKTEKKEGKEEKLGKARKLRAALGVRDRSEQRVEIVGLEDPEKKEKFAAGDALFVVEGGYGLHDGDVVKVEEAEHKDEKKE
jgi:RND family efflux transporter MFP subunit